MEHLDSRQDERERKRAQEAKRAGWIDALLVFALSLGYLSVLPRCFSLFDEGVVADTAERIYLGEVLYRDLFSYWNPGGFWLNAALFHLAGVSVETLRVPLALFAAAAAVGVWRLARDHSGRVLAISAGLAVTLVCYPIWWMASSHWYSTFTAVGAAIAFRRCITDRPTYLEVSTAGALCGITFIMLQPVGGFVSIALFASLAWDSAFFASRAAALKRLAVFSLGTLSPLALMYGYYAAQGALGVMLYDTLLWNLKHFSPTLGADYGESVFLGPAESSTEVVRWGLMVLPPFSCVLAIAVAVVPYLQGKASSEDRRLFALAAFSISLLMSNYYYPDLVHLAFGAPPAFALLVALVARCGANEQGRHVARALTFAFAAFIGFVGINSAKDYTDRCPAEIETPRGTIRTVPALVDDFRALFSFFEARLSPSRHFYVYPYGPGYNFLVGHPSVAPYPAIFPHRPTLTTPEQFAEVLSALQQEQIQFVVVPFTYRAMLGNSDLELERYILTHYRVLNEGARTLILERNRVDKKGRKISPRRGFAQ